MGRIVSLLAVDSTHRSARDRSTNDIEVDYHAVRVIYRTEIVGGELRHETDESTDRAAWCTRDDVVTMPLVGLARLGLDLAFGGKD